MSTYDLATCSPIKHKRSTLHSELKSVFNWGEVSAAVSAPLFPHLCLILYHSHRIVVHGDVFLSAVVPRSAQPFNFASEYHLTEDEVHLCFFLLHSSLKTPDLWCIRYIYMGLSLTAILSETPSSTLH